MNAPRNLEHIKGGQHLLAAYDGIRQAGIREARQMHVCRLKRIRMLHDQQMFAATIHPAQSAGEAMDDAKRFLANWRNMTTWRQANHYTRMLEAKERIVICRYFARYGERIWARRAA